MRATRHYSHAQKGYCRALAPSALCLALIMAAAPAEARRLRLGGWKSSPSTPAPAPAAAPRQGTPVKSGNTLVVIPSVGAAKASAQEAKPEEKRQIMPPRMETPPVAKVEPPTGPRSEIPVLGATASARPAPSGFAALN